MSEANIPANASLFPARDNVKQVEKEAIAQLPITKPNDLIAILRLHANTVLKANNTH